MVHNTMIISVFPGLARCPRHANQTTKKSEYQVITNHRVTSTDAERSEKAALPGVTGFKAVLQKTEELDVADQAPWGLVHETWWNLADKAFY